MTVYVPSTQLAFSAFIEARTCCLRNGVTQSGLGCGGLTGISPHSMKCWNTWSPVSGTIWLGLGGVPLLEEVQRGRLWSFKDWYPSKFSLFVLCLQFKMWRLLLPDPGSMFHFATRDSNLLEPEAKVTFFFYVLPWSWYCIIALERQLIQGSSHIKQQRRKVSPYPHPWHTHRPIWLSSQVIPGSIKLTIKIYSCNALPWFCSDLRAAPRIRNASSPHPSCSCEEWLPIWHSALVKS